MNLRVLSPNFHIHVPVRDLYVPMIGLPIVCYRKLCGPIWEYINCSQTHKCGNWVYGRAISFLGIHKWDFRCSA
jgi:hypothetical protein